jgi:hypothetical protein
MSDDLAPAPGRFFAVLMPWGRVGSNLVAATLAASPDIVIDNEPATRIRTLGARDGLSRAAMNAAQFAHLAEFHQTHRGAARTAGIKLSHRSLIAPRDYAQRLADLGFVPVIMLRDNFLKCAISQMRATARAEPDPQTGRHWQSPWAVARSEPKPGPVHIDPAEALRLVRVFEKHHNALIETAEAVFGPVFGPDVLRIEYRDLAADPEGTIGNLFIRFGLTPPEVIALPYQKATSDALREDITNYAEFAQAVEEAGLAHFLEQDA